MAANERFPQARLSPEHARYLLITLLLVAAIARLIALYNPPVEHYDEVYQAFTARRVLNGDPNAWDWGHEAPPGYAYSWTHPPMARLGMVLGMLVFGENAFGWRFPAAALGVAAIFLVYRIARKLFDDDLVSLLAAAAFAADGLPLVMSRVGMIEMYLVFFLLATLYFYLEDRVFLTALFLGFAAATKWSSFWLLPVLGIIFLLKKRRLDWRYAWFAVLPPIVYAASYVPMLFTGHDVGHFFATQRQMWLYHTDLDATHSYASSPLTWPLMLRPVWFYSESWDGMTANIYAMGNPAVFWFGVMAVVSALIYAVARRDREVGIVALAYFGLFVPWMWGPRIMFLHHYLSAVPFMAISIGFVLRKIPRLIIPFFVIAGLLFLYFYPHWTGISVPVWLDNSYYWLPSWR